MSRARTGSVHIQRGGAIYARVTWTDGSGKRVDKKRRARSREHAKELCTEMLIEAPPLPVSPGGFERGCITLHSLNVSIYFIQMSDGHTNPIKIGLARDVQSRMAQLLTGSPYELRLLGSWPIHPVGETILHGRFDHLHMRGEWFRPDDDLLTFIKKRGILDEN